MRPNPCTAAKLLIALMFTAPMALAHEAHQHGVAQLDLVREGGELEIQLKVDGEGVVGFERAPRDAAERGKVEAARLALADGGKLFGLPAAAGCRFVVGDVDVPHAEASDHAHDHDEGSAHADWQANYRFECDRGAAAAIVDFAGLFTAFPGITRAQLQWITDDGQSGAELTPARSTATLEAE